MKNEEKTDIATAWAELEAGVREGVEDRGGDTSMTDYVCKRLRAVYAETKHGMDIEVTGMNEIGLKSIEALNRFHLDNGTVLWGRLALSFMEIYEASNGVPTAKPDTVATPATYH
jgi:hypothetical protein